MDRVGHRPYFKTTTALDPPKDHTVYILSQRGRSLFEQPTQGSRQYYTGVTTNVRRRLLQHNTGKTKATHGIEWEIVAYISGFTRAQAYMVEKYLKRGDTREKRAEFYRFALDDDKDDTTAGKYFCIVEKKCRHFKWFGREQELEFFTGKDDPFLMHDEAMHEASMEER